mmetsp:Transcript_2101/g.1515  ORF Transcript_2101/g.1515 Transcript_2101/m.1515 type:complete len:98 (+) Transcript_2101:79-372(+)
MWIKKQGTSNTTKNRSPIIMETAQNNSTMAIAEMMKIVLETKKQHPSNALNASPLEKYFWTTIRILVFSSKATITANPRMREAIRMSKGKKIVRRMR